MARPKAGGLIYFTHDCDASNDEKIEAMRANYGNDGYAFYFILLERVYRANDFELFIGDAETLNVLIKKTAVPAGKFDKMLRTALKVGLFDQNSFNDRKVLTSSGIKKRSLTVTKKREQMAELYQRKKVSAAETPPETPHSIVKNSIVKNSKVIKSDTPAGNTHSQDDKDEFEKLTSWMAIDAPEVLKMEKPLTIDGYIKLKNRIGKPLIKTLVEAMENRPDLRKKNRSTYLTINNWSKREFNNPNDNTTNSKESARLKAEERTAQLASER